MRKIQHKNILNSIFIPLFIFLLLPFYFARTTSAQTTNGSQLKPRDAGIDMGMVYNWLRFGKIVPDSEMKTLGWRGTGFAVSPSTIGSIVNAVALQWIFGVAPTKGVTNYSTSILDDMKTAGYISSQEEVGLLRSAGAGSLSFPTTFEPLPNDQKNKTGAEKGEIKKFADLPGIIFGGANRAGNDMLLTGMALARADDLSASLPDPGSMLPEQKGSRLIGKNNTGSTSSGTSPYEVLGGEGGQIITPTNVKNAQGLLQAMLPAWAALANPDGGQVAVNTGPMASNIGKTDAEKSVTSARVAGNAAPFGKINEVSGYTDKQPGAPLTDMSDLANLAAQNSADQINNILNQINNAQNHFPNDPNLNNLQNQFPPDQFNNLLNNRFPGGGGGNGGGTPTPPVTPTTPNTSVCDPTKAVLSQQEVIDIADFMGLTLDVSKWTISYFQAKQFLGITIYLGDSTSTQVVDQTLISNPNSCIWVVYAPSVNEGAYVTDARNQTGIKFLFRMP